MKVKFLGIDESLIDGLKATYGLVDTLQSIDDIENSSETDILVLTDRFLDYNEISEHNYSKYQFVFYVMRNEIEPVLERTIKAICDGKNIHYLSAHLTSDQVLAEISQAVNPTVIADNHVYTFFSSISNVGTTSTTLSTAYALSDRTEARVGVLVLNAWDSGSDFLKYKGLYLDEIKGNLLNKFYDSDDTFLNAFQEVKKDSLYIMLGNRNVKMERLYTKEEIEKLIDRAKSVFDIVLIDAGSHYDNANMFQSLYSSDYRFLVVNQREKVKRKFDEAFHDVLKPVGFQREQFMLIINQYEEDNVLPKTKDVRSSFSIPVLTAIEKSNNGYLSELENKSLYLYEDYKYQEAIHVIARTIAAQSRIPFIEHNKKKKLFGFN